MAETKLERNPEPSGTKATKYSPATEGPFRCDRCVHFMSTQGHNLCQHKDVVKDPQIKKVKLNGETLAVVDRGGCCEYFRGVRQLVHITFEKLGM
jgi:hypothetical protein